MRDKNRIDRIMSMLTELWEKDNDLRFMQFLYNLQSDYSKSRSNGYGKVEDNSDITLLKVGFDMFYLEDDKFEQFLANKMVGIK